MDIVSVIWPGLLGIVCVFSAVAYFLLREALRDPVGAKSVNLDEHDPAHEESDEVTNDHRSDMESQDAYEALLDASDPDSILDEHGALPAAYQYLERFGEQRELKPPDLLKEANRIGISLDEALIRVYSFRLLLLSKFNSRPKGVEEVIWQAANDRAIAIQERSGAYSKPIDAIVEECYLANNILNVDIVDERLLILTDKKPLFSGPNTGPAGTGTKYVPIADRNIQNLSIGEKRRFAYIVKCIIRRSQELKKSGGPDSKLMSGLAREAIGPSCEISGDSGFIVVTDSKVFRGDCFVVQMGDATDIDVSEHLREYYESIKIESDCAPDSMFWGVTVDGRLWPVPANWPSFEALNAEVKTAFIASHRLAGFFSGHPKAGFFSGPSAITITILRANSQPENIRTIIRLIFHVLHQGADKALRAKIDAAFPGPKPQQTWKAFKAAALAGQELPPELSHHLERIRIMVANKFAQTGKDDKYDTGVVVFKP